jgi:hypothetical protein
MAHSTSLSLDLSNCLLSAQREIHYLCTQLSNTEDTLRDHQKIQVGQDSDFYSSDLDHSIIRSWHWRRATNRQAPLVGLLSALGVSYPSVIMYC